MSEGGGEGGTDSGLVSEQKEGGASSWPLALISHTLMRAQGEASSSPFLSQSPNPRALGLQGGTACLLQSRPSWDDCLPL